MVTYTARSSAVGMAGGAQSGFIVAVLDAFADERFVRKRSKD